jgi:hypothetical protein
MMGSTMKTVIIYYESMIRLEAKKGKSKSTKHKKKLVNAERLIHIYFVTTIDIECWTYSVKERLVKLSNASTFCPRS